MRIGRPERLHLAGQADVLDEAIADRRMAAGGVVGRALDQDRLAVGEGQLRSVVVHPVQGERLHQDDPAQRLHELLPEGLAPQLGQQADQDCPVGSGRTPS